MGLETPIDAAHRRMKKAFTSPEFDADRDSFRYSLRLAQPTHNLVPHWISELLALLVADLQPPSPHFLIEKSTYLIPWTLVDGSVILAWHLLNNLLWMDERMRCLVLRLPILLWSVASFASAQHLTASQAKAHEGENATVCGVVAGEHTATSSRGQPTFINLDVPYPRQVFTALIWGEDRRNVGALPQTGDRICITGLITDFRGEPEIVVRSKSQITH